MKFVNLSNHPSEGWDDAQLSAAQRYGEVVDIHFPNVEPAFSSELVNSMAELVVNTLTAFDSDITVHIMGEMTFTYAVVSRLKALGITCLASTTERSTVILPDGRKVSEFKFVQFREY